MSTIKNKARRPLKIHLSQGKVLHLGLGKEGQITAKDEERESIKKLIEAGDLEIIEGATPKANPQDGPVPGRKPSGGGGHQAGKAKMSHGDR